MIARLLLVTLVLLGSPLPATAGEVRPARTDSYGDPLPPGVLARLGSVRFRCRFEPHRMEFTPDGLLLVMCDDHGNTDIFHWPSGLLHRRHTCEEMFGEELWAWERVSSVRFTPDSRRMIVVCSHRVVEFDLYTRARVVRLTNPFGSCLATSPDCRFVVTGIRKRGLFVHADEYYLYDLHARYPKPIRIDGRFAWNDSLRFAFSPDGLWMAFANSDEPEDTGPPEIALMDLRTGSISVRKTGGVPTGALEFSPDGRSVLSEGRNGAHILPIRSDGDRTAVPRFALPIPVIRSDEPFAFLHFVDGWRAMLVAAPDGSVYRMDVKTRSVRPVARTSPSPRLVRSSPDGRWTATLGERDSTPTIWRSDATPVSDRAGHTGHITELAFAPNGRTLHSGSYDGTIRTWSVVPRVVTGSSGRTPEERFPSKEILARAVGATVVGLRLRSPRGDLLSATHGADGYEWLRWDDGSPVPGRSWNRGIIPEVLETIPEYATEWPSSERCLVADARTGAILRTIAPGRSVGSSCLHPDGRTMLVAFDSTDDVAAWDLATGVRLREIPPWSSGVASRLWSDLNPYELRAELIRDRATGKVVDRFRGNLFCLTLTAGERLAVYLDDERVRLYDRLGGRTVTLYEGRRCSNPYIHGMSAVAVSPDGTLVAVGYGNGEIHLIDRRPYFRDPARPATPREWQSLWDGLARSDFDPRDFGSLISQFPAEAVAELHQRRRPPERLSPDRLRVLLKQFDDENYLRREAATREVRRGLPITLPGLEAFLKGKPSAEAEGRVRRLVEEGTAWPPSGHRLRELRMVGLLETIGTTEAKALLREYATHPDGAIATSAKDSLVRLRK